SVNCVTGANTAIFSLVNALVFNPLPYSDPQRLVWVTTIFRGDELIGVDMYYTFQAESRTLDHLAAYEIGTMDLSAGDIPDGVNCMRATASVFPTLGVTPMLGRAFTEEDDRPGASPVVVLSYDYWQRRFGGDLSIIGKSFGAKSVQVIGVLPPEIHFLPEHRTGGKVDLWFPFRIDRQREGNRIIEGGVFGRLRPGISVEQSRTELDLILRRFLQDRPFLPTGYKTRVTPLAERLVGHWRLGLLTLFGSVGFVLLIACASVANLLLARAGRRQKELAIRAALGAGRIRLIRQMLTESLLLSMLGGTAGLLLALWGVKALVAYTPQPIAYNPENLLVLKLSGVDKTALVFTFLATLLTGFAAGAIPALQASRIDLNEGLKDGDRGAILLKRRGARRVSPAIVIAELALTLIVLIGAGLLIKSFARVRAVDPGYNPENLLTMEIDDWDRDHRAQEIQFNRELHTRLNALPGVQAAAKGSLPLTETGIITRRLAVVGGEPVPDEKKPLALEHSASPDYFRAMEIKLLAGREFTDLDTENPGATVTVISETLARRLFGADDPIGKRIQVNREKTDLTIVGVVADIKEYGLETESQAAFYRPSYGGYWVIRTSGDPLKMLPALRQEIAALKQDYKLSEVMTMEQLVADSSALRRFQTWLFGLFAIVALVIATVGIYGVISSDVDQRTHEIGVRMALGARAGEVLRMVIWRGMRLTLAGLTLGAAAAFALTRVLKNLLFEVSATDPATFVLIALLLAIVALLACLIPARRATRVDPLVALRHE
ncbi:MAG: ABC transporter permease, partial [Blastocatellia bacterium]|nr:ABC transporter permease [Blastocatellia bacterium]